MHFTKWMCKVGECEKLHGTALLWLLYRQPKAHCTFSWWTFHLEILSRGGGKCGDHRIKGGDNKICQCSNIDVTSQVPVESLWILPMLRCVWSKIHVGAGFLSACAYCENSALKGAISRNPEVKNCATMCFFTELERMLDIVAMSQPASNEGGSSNGTQQQVHNLWQS